MNLKNNKLIRDLKDLKALCLSYEASDKKIVMTNGCFDILHAGHTYILEKSKKLGDILIVALNSDLSIKKIKSKDRPIVSELDRAYVLSCLSSVDHIILFDNESPEEIICKILPEILIKGSDYKGKKVAGEDCLIKNGKKVVLIDLIEGKSSTSIIDKVSKL
ncbi:MAG: adenylyltransferase/cytidyltransferase family protein [Gammaproteobacteria bacterium]|jgi:D-beta-D-heptose 7-phosphate kinase/D-beta-D-heptose 1-phosphate adenosyltransferase|nr:adenylyltransferase/cytidyltransferase family protein [Gammaproteobacteria bacterium]|tara:strand:+ start:9386 stop:9871 length:486 start_codon:yes stop_codon:yes gene_type:complete